jgi:hypothetical protein
VSEAHSLSSGSSVCTIPKPCGLEAATRVRLAVGATNFRGGDELMLSWRTQRSNLALAALRLLRRYAPRNDRVRQQEEPSAGAAIPQKAVTYRSSAERA